MYRTDESGISLHQKLPTRKPLPTNMLEIELRRFFRLNIYMDVAKFERSLGDFARTHGISKIRCNKICFTSFGANLVDRLLPALCITPDNQNPHA